MTILITGANGNVSSALLKSLSAVGLVNMRALVRDPAKAPTLPDVEVVVGDLDRPNNLDEAFAGIDTLWLLTAMGPQAPNASMNAVWAARRAGVRHVVRLSAVGAAHDAPNRNGRLHALSDHELQASGIAWTIIRPHFFMQNLLGSVVGNTLYGSLGEGRLGMIDVRDVAEFGAQVLVDPQAHAGKTYTITGPASISLHDAAAAVAQVHRSAVTYKPLTEAEAYESMIGFGLSEWIAAGGVEYGMAYAHGWGDFTTSDFSEVVGRQATSFDKFARNHTAALGAH